MRLELQNLYDRLDATQPKGTSGMAPMLEELVRMDTRLDEITVRVVECEDAAARRKAEAAAAA
jgi:hypothetical protein